MAGYQPHPYQVKGVLFAAKQQMKHVWPFAVGLGITTYIIASATAGLTPEDIKASKFANPKQGH